MVILFGCSDFAAPDDKVLLGAFDRCFELKEAFKVGSLVDVCDPCLEVCFVWLVGEVVGFCEFWCQWFDCV